MALRSLASTSIRGQVSKRARCAGRMQLMATIEDPAVIQRLLAQLWLPGAREDPRPPLPLTAAGAEQPALPGVTV